MLAERTAARDVARAVWFTAPRVAELREEAIRAPALSEVRIGARWSAISPGTEMLVYRGQVDPSLALDLPTLHGSFAFPIKYGYASVGVIDAVGPEVLRLKPGDHVFVHHPHESGYVVPEASAHLLPPGADPQAATLLANLETAINIVLDARPHLGDRVLVFGQGIVGLLVTQLLRRSGVHTLIAVDPIAKRRSLATSLGADHVYQPGGALREEIMRLTDGSGADLAIEVSGNPAALDQAIDCLRFQGTVVAASWYGIKPVTLHLGGAFHRNRLRIISSQVSQIDPALGPAWTRARRMQTAISLLRVISWAPLITHRFPLERAAEAYRLVDEQPEETVQVLFTYV